MKATPWFYLPIILSALLVLNAKETNFEARSSLGQERPPNVGFILALTGPLAEFGQAIRNGVTLAQEDIPDLKNLFTPIYEDSRYDSKTALSAYRRLSSQAGLLALYVFGGPMSDSLAPIAEAEAHPLFSTEYDTRYTRGRSYIVRFANNAEDYAEALLSSLRERGLTSIALVKVENQYHNTLSEALIRKLRPGESVQITTNVLPGERDFRSIVARLNGTTFEALGVYLTPGMQKAFFQQYQPRTPPRAIFGTDTFESADENSGLEQKVSGALFANSFVTPHFAARYAKRFGDQSQLVHAALAYEFARLLGDIIRKHGPRISKLQLLESLKQVRNRESACGNFSYRWTPETGAYFSFPIAIRRVEGAQPTVTKVVPAP